MKFPQIDLDFISRPIYSNSYRNNLNKFYSKLMYKQYMSNKQEIARQDVILTPEGPVELYRRDINGAEKVLDPNDYELIKRQYKTKFDFTEYLAKSNNYYNGNVINYPHKRQPRRQQRHAFDWYDKVSSKYSIIDEKVQVLPNKYDNYYDNEDEISRKSYYSPRRRYSSRSSSSRRRYRSGSRYDDDIYDDYSNSYSSGRRSSEYDVYEYYEYDDDYSRSSRSSSRYNRERRDSAASSSRTPPSPPPRHRRRRIPKAYVEYDSYEYKREEPEPVYPRPRAKKSSLRPHVVSEDRFSNGPKTDVLVDIEDQ